MANVSVLIKRMRKNAAQEGWQVWKNIPIALEYYEILAAHTGVLEWADAIFNEDLLDQRSCPRLCLKFLDLCLKEAPGNEEYLQLKAKWEDYIDLSVPNEEWIKRYGAHLKFDPVERTPEWEEVCYEVEKECDRRLKGEPRGMGFCFVYWSVKRDVLSKYGIDWKSPSFMNPRVMFD